MGNQFWTSCFLPLPERREALYSVLGRWTTQEISSSPTRIHPILEQHKVSKCIKHTHISATASMESSGVNESAPSKIGDRSTSDVVVRLRTPDGRDDRLYCHSHVIVEKSKYFADRLSDDWPTCQFLDSRNCVEVYCEESDFDFHVNLLRRLYLVGDDSVHDSWHDVKNTLGILRVAVQLECPKIIAACVSYMEAVPWEEAEEEEILKTIPAMGLQVEPILGRVQPVNSSAIMKIFLAAIRFATSSPPQSLSDLKVSAQEQLEYMLTEDDDAPLLVADDDIKSVVKDCVKQLFTRFDNLLQTLISKPKESVFEEEEMQSFQSHLSDFSWACQILTKLEIMREFVNSWVDRSEKVAKVIEQASSTNDMVATKLKVTEVAAKVLEAIGYATVILPATKRLHMVKVWLPFVRATKPAFESITNEEEAQVLKFDGELWQALESTFVSIILALPSDDQADILKEWLENVTDTHVRYPDLTEAFEVWCYRSKVAQRRLALVQDGIEGMTCE